MKTHTQTFKQNLIKLGKEINAKITYTINGTTTELDGESLASVTPHFKGNILKSVMKQVDIVSDIDIPLETQINVQFGMKYDSGSFEYINFGNYIVYSSEKQEDTNNYKIVAYDKMLYAMKDYEELSITYPCTIKQFIIKLAQNMGLGASLPNDFVNQDRELTQDVFVGLGYTKRDVLDQLAEVTASTICINNEDTLEIRYLQDNINATSTASGTDLSFNADDEDFILELLGNTTQDGTPTPSSPIPVNVVSGDNTIDICGKNLLEGIELGDINSSTGVPSASTNSYRSLNYIAYDTSKTYYVSINGSTLSATINIRMYNKNYEYIGYGTLIGSGSNFNIRKTTTVADDTPKYFKFRTALANIPSADAKIMLSTLSDLTYEPYIGKSYPIYLGVENLFDGVNYQGYITSDGTVNTSDARLRRTDYISVNSNTQYDVSTNTSMYATGISYYDSTKTFISRNQNTNVSNVSFTTPSNAKYVIIAINYNNSSNLDSTSMETYGLQLEIGSKRNHPSTTPIELCKIGNYQDFIRKGTRKNLCNITSATCYQYSSNLPTTPSTDITINSFDSNAISITSATNGYRAIVSNTMQLQANQQYTLSFTSSGTGSATDIRTFVWLLDENNAYVSNFRVSGHGNKTLSFTTNSTGKIALGFGWGTNSNGSTSTYKNIQVELGSATLYEPYNCNYWYLYKVIGKVVLDGTESWSSASSVVSGTTRFYYNNNIYKNDGGTTASIKGAMSNNFLGMTFDKIYAGDTTTRNAIAIYGNDNNRDGRVYIRIDNTYASDVATFKTWLSTNKPIVYYLMRTPTTTEITNTELIKDLEKPKLLMGLNNIASDSPLNIEYVSDYETIDENYIKNNRVDFGEKYGPVNSIVLSRSADSDNVYLKDQDSIDENGLCEIKIKNNQVMNDNDRSDYLPEILNKLKGLSYYINDFESIGITYLDLCDKYKVKIGDTKYSCVMFNDEVEIQNGLNELIYTDKPEMSQTDYRKASESDKAERQTYLIVDKQAQRIDAVVSTQEEFDESLSQLSIDVDGIQTKVELNYDFVREVEHTNNVSSEEMQKEGLIQLSIKGTAISSNYLRLNISNNTQAYVDLPITSILYLDEDTYDELSIENVYNEETGIYEYHTFITKKLDYIDNTIVQRSNSNNYLLDETTTPLATESSENLLLDDFHLDKQDLGVLDLTIDSGEHTFSINGYNNLQYYLKYIIVNNITSDLVQSRHIISEINQSAEEIQISADKVSLQGKEINLTSDDIVINSNNFSVDKNGKITATAGDIGGFNMDNVKFFKAMNGKYYYSIYDLNLVKAYYYNWVDFSSTIFNILDTNNDSVLNAIDLVKIQKELIDNTPVDKIVGGRVEINSNNPKNCLGIYNNDNEAIVQIGIGGVNSEIFSGRTLILGPNQANANQTFITASGDTGMLRCVTLIQSSVEEAKKNFEKLENALDIVKDVDIYKYNFKFEENYDKKHIGFVIGDKFKYRREITNNKNDGAELYSMISVLYKAVQEQQEQIEELKKEIDILKGGK